MYYTDSSFGISILRAMRLLRIFKVTRLVCDLCDQGNVGNASAYQLQLYRVARKTAHFFLLDVKLIWLCKISTEFYNFWHTYT